MRELFKSRLFRRLFCTYIIVIFTCFIVYTSFIVYEHIQINSIQRERRGEMQLDEVGSILDRRITNAQNIVQNLSYSTALKQLYLNSKLGTVLDSYNLFMIQSELKNTMASGGLSVYKTIIFLNGSDKAYSSSGVIKLSNVFNAENVEYPYLELASLNEAFGFDSNRYSFQKECLLYCDAYTYQNGSEIGTVCILFDLKNLRNNLDDAINDDYGLNILYGNREFITMGERKGKIFSAESSCCPDLFYQVYAPVHIFTEENVVFYILLGIMVMISLGFVYLAYRESRKYYMPIDHLDQLVKEEKGTRVVEAGGEPEGSRSDEMENLIHGIRNLIGEKNGYREKMMTITPYARTGVLHSMITGDIGKENIRILSKEHYIDLIKPYFIVGVADLAYIGGKSGDAENHGDGLEEIFQVMADAFSTDEIRIVSYFRDSSHAFLIANVENEEPMDQLFYQIHKYLCTALGQDQYAVTMGVDILRADINELQEACEGAMTALDGILTDGRGEVYFLEENSGKTADYYFPTCFREKLKKYLEKDRKEELRDMLADIYRRNWDMGGNPEMYRGLIDELHLSIIKTLKEITELNTTHFSVEKYRGLATLQEVFDYYGAALCSIADSLYEQAVQAQEDSRLEDEILKYIDDNCFDSELSLQMISERFKVSSKYLSLLCKKRYKMTYLQYIQDKRIQKASQLLSERKYSLSEIAVMCGYANQLTFRRNFKSVMGINPSDYQ